MKSLGKSVLLAAGLALPTMASQCVSITDPLVITLNVKDIKHTYDITPGAQSFTSPCITRNPADYLDQNYNINGAHLVDVLVQTVGDFAGGNVNNGLVTINGTTLGTYSGSWDAFHTPQSILTSNLLQKNPAGVTVLLNAIQSQSTITLCDGGAFSQAAPSGLQILVTVYAQVNATP